MVIDHDTSKSELNARLFKYLVNLLNDTMGNVNLMMSLINKQQQQQELSTKSHFDILALGSHV